MLNDMIRYTNMLGHFWITAPKGTAEGFVEYVENAAKELDGEAPEVKIYEAGKVPLEELPEDVQREVRGTLRAYDVCHVEYEHGAFHARTCACLQASYPQDHFVVGTYRAKDVYTEEQRRQNFIEEFGYAP